MSTRQNIKVRKAVAQFLNNSNYYILLKPLNYLHYTTVYYYSSIALSVQVYFEGYREGKNGFLLGKYLAKMWTMVVLLNQRDVSLTFPKEKRLIL